MAKKRFQRVILYARQLRANQDVNETLNHLITFLQTQDVGLYLDVDTAACFELDLPVLPRKSMQQNHDLIIVVGGDGSLLSAARMAINVNVPVIGINRGQLGFLTDISPYEIETQLTAILDGKYIEENRSLIHMNIYEQDKICHKGDALNDVVLSRGNETRLVTFDVLINDLFVSHYRADGLILATPTGSTAYALSAGGPIMHPQLDAIIMVPMFSHSLSSRPLVIDGQSKVELHISEENENELQISCDGHESYSVKPGQKIKIKKHSRQLNLLHPIDYHYYDTLRIKLGWGSAG